MTDASAFSPDFTAARARFRSSALAAGFELETLPIGQLGPDSEPLTIDAALLGATAPQRVVVVSSGLHGVEGYLGSAIQAALLEDGLGGWRPPHGMRLVLLHGLNPYGFAWSRRVNERNVDLNRNFLLEGDAFIGASEGYAELDELLNPSTPPTAFDPFLLQAAGRVARSGLGTLTKAVSTGQYDYPKGLFYGGAEPSRTQNLLKTHLPRWVGGASRVLHVDVHSGLGRWGQCGLLTHGQDRAAELSEMLGHSVLPHSLPIAERGGLGPWCRALFSAASYDVVVAGFGTYGPLRVVSALRAEQRAHLYGPKAHPSTERAKQTLREVFAPSDRRWRDAVVPLGLRCVHAAIGALA